MENINDLSKEELMQLDGGASFAYRAGQVIAVTLDGVDGMFTSTAAIMALVDWFG